MFGRSNTGFDRLLEKATSQLLLEPDWDAILQICDAIRQGDTQARYAVATIKRKIGHENPHICMFALQVLESCVKNCGAIFHAEMATKEMMEFLKDQVKARGEPVKAKLLELIQVWSHAFRNEPAYKIVQDTYNLMKLEGYQFPTLKEADAMFAAEKAPEWKDGECCHRCRERFSMVQRKHHCRNCGEIFCNKCSAKSSIIPKYGIEREVRVCETCYSHINKTTPKKGSEDDLPAEYLASPLSQQPQTPPSKSEQELQEEEELQLAIALSQSEAETKGKGPKTHSNYGMYSGSSEPSSAVNTAYTPPTVSAPVIDTSDMDPELARYLNRNYWEQKAVATTTTPSAPVAVSANTTTQPKATTVTTTGVAKVQEQYQNGETNEQEEFLNALHGSIEIFVNRMKSNSMRGRSIANDSSVQTLFQTICAMHPQLMSYAQEQEDLRAHFESLQDKLAQLRDAREALDALREEHAEKKRREAEELERQRQIQMAQKLEIMRQKKQEYLEYQRQLALQRMQEQEREMQMRLEQQKQMQHMRQMQYSYPQVYPQQAQAFSAGGGSLEGSPLHQPYGQHAQMSMQQQQPTMLPPGGAQQPGMTSLPLGVNQSPYMPPPTGQPVYSQGGMPPPVQQPGIPTQAPLQQPPPPQGYPGVQAPPATSYQPPGQAGYMPAPGAPAGQSSQPVTQQGYAPPPAASMDYSSFNMQNMNNALPPQTAAQPQYSQPMQGQQQQYMNPAQPQQYPPGTMLPPQQQQVPQQPQQREAELISFD